MKRIGFLATGSEIISGEILNRDSQLMAQQLIAHGMPIGEHLVVDDQDANLKAALQFMLSRHDVVITTGGLGPTADDRTRDIIAKQIQQPLVFDQASWDAIVTRFARYQITLTDNNKQQAFFPQGTEILINIAGSANGCRAEAQGKTIFMLPGPPRECIPMFERDVLPFLQQNGYGSNLRLYRWRLMGVAEAAIAEQLDHHVAQPFNIDIAYRATFPYTDVKVMIDKSARAQKLIRTIEELVAPYFISHEDRDPSAHLAAILPQHIDTLTIDDQATHGRLQQALLHPNTRPCLHFSDHHADIKMSGLDSYWQDPTATTTQLSITGQVNQHPINHHVDIPVRGENTLRYAVELCAHQILKALS